MAGLTLTAVFIFFVIAMLFGAKDERARRYSKKPYKNAGDLDAGSSGLSENTNYNGGGGADD